MKVSVGKLSKNLSRFIGLKQSEDPKVEIDEKSAPGQLVMGLVRAGLMPHHSQVPEDMSDLVRKAEEEGPSRIEGCVVDLLGEYRPGLNVVILYERLIRECARKHGFRLADLQRLVLTHELAHQVTHRGLDSDGNEWKNFEHASLERVEYFAQIYTYKVAKMRHWEKCVRIMDTLSKSQPETYSHYLKHIRLSPDAINRELMKERRKEPSASIITVDVEETPMLETALLASIQSKIDAIEAEIKKLRAKTKDFDSNPLEMAEKLGKGEEYDRLLKGRDELMWLDAIEHEIKVLRAKEQDFKTADVEMAGRLGKRRAYEELLKKCGEMMRAEEKE